MTQAAVQSWTGRSDEIAVPLLGAEFWTDGREVSGVFEGFREQKVGGPAFKLTLDSPVSFDGEDVTVVEVPSLTGVRNALQSLKKKGYQSKIGDLWRVQCVGIKKAKKEEFSDSPEFQIDVIRK
ncbi:MAG TPA: hypothetical protein VE077_17695 [Candidatus Methylomirabilis sp.]|nr:hypothetical protein [Candidatus Methylomirabilis sp.]